MEDFETYRPLLFSIAYRMTGSASQAEDSVQDTYLHYRRVDSTTIRSLKAFLTTTIVNLCLNYLKSAHVKREEYIGVWLPEPVLTSLVDDESLEKKFEQQESLSVAFLILLEALTPPERAVFLLHEVFDYSFAEIAEIIEKSPENCRQLFHRAKNHVAEKRQRVSVSQKSRRQLTESFLAACQSGNLASLTQLLASEVVASADGGGKVRAALHPIPGRDTVAKLCLIWVKQIPAHHVQSIEEINGAPALLSWDGPRLNLVLTFEIVNASIVGLRSHMNPEKLAFLQRQLEKRQEQEKIFFPE